MSAPWHQRSHDGFGRLVVDPAAMARDDRLRELRRVSGRLAADPDAGVRWVASGLLAWSVGGQDIADALGLRPARGSRRTIERLAQQSRRDAALLGLAVAVGNDRAALRILRGEDACPAHAAEALAAAQRAGCPASANAVSRARNRQRLMTR